VAEPGLKRVEAGRANRVDLTPKQKLVALISNFKKKGSLSSTEITILRELMSKNGSLFKTLTLAQQTTFKSILAKYGNGAGLKVVITPPPAAPPKPVTVPPMFKGTKHKLITVTTGQSHETIIAKGDANSKYVYFIAKGEVEVHIRPGVVKTLKTGSFVGEIGTFLDIPRTADVKMKAGAVLVRMEKVDFKALLQSNPVLKAQIFTLVKKRLSENVIRFLSSRKMLTQRGKITGPINSPAKTISSSKLYQVYKTGGFPAVAKLMLDHSLELALKGDNKYLAAMLKITNGKATGSDAQVIFSMFSSGQTHLHPTRSIPPSVVLKYGIAKLAAKRNSASESAFWNKVNSKVLPDLWQNLYKDSRFKIFKNLKGIFAYAERAQAQGDTKGYKLALEALKKLIEYKPAEGKGSLIEYLKYGKFLSTLLYETPQDIANMSYEVAKSQYNRGTRYVELRFSPLQGNIPISTAIKHYVQGLMRAQAQFSGLKCKAIIIFDTTMTRQEAIELKDGLVKFMRRNPALARSVVGIDTAGPEVSKTAGGVELPDALAERLGGKMTRNGQTHHYFDIKKFADIFTELRGRGLSITLHSGENFLSVEQGFDNIERAVRLGAKRLGHGIILGTDIDQYLGKKDVFGREYTPKRIAALKARQTVLLKLVAHQGIVIEVCPDSNLHTSPLTYDKHPVNKFLKYGIRVTVSDDNSALDNTSGSQQILEVARHQRLSPFAIFKLFLSSSRLGLDKVKTKGTFGLLEHVRKSIGNPLDADVIYLKKGLVKLADSRFTSLVGKTINLPGFKGSTLHYNVSNVPAELRSLLGSHKYLYLVKAEGDRVIAIASDTTLDVASKTGEISRIIQRISLIRQYSVDNVGANTLAKFYIDMHRMLSSQRTNIHQIVLNLSSPAKGRPGVGLKAINDTYSHKAGTATLKEIHRRLKARFGEGVRIYRLGANFVIHFDKPLEKVEMERYVKELIAEFDKPIEVKDGSGKSIFTKRLSTFIRGLQYRNDALLEGKGIGLEKYVRCIKWFLYQLNAIPQGNADADIMKDLVHGLEKIIQEKKIPPALKYSVPKVRRNNKLLFKMIGFIQKHINTVDKGLVAELFKTAYIEPDSKMLTYEAIRLLMKRGFFKRGTWSMSALDGNRFGAFIKTYKSLGSDMLELVIGKRMRYLAETFLAKKGCVLFRHGANSEEFYIVGKMAPEKLAGIIKDFYKLLLQKIEIRIPLDRLEKVVDGKRVITDEGRIFYAENKGNYKVVDGHVKINVQLIPRGEGADRTTGLSFAGAVNRVDNANPEKSFERVNLDSERAKDLMGKPKNILVRSSLTPRVVFKAYGIKCKHAWMFDKLAHDNPKAFKTFVQKLWKAGVRELDIRTIQEAFGGKDLTLKTARAGLTGVSMKSGSGDKMEINQGALDKIAKTAAGKVKRIKGSKFATLDALDVHLKKLSKYSQVLYTDGKLVVSKRNALRYAKALSAFDGILGRASMAVGNRTGKQQLLLSISEVVRNRKVKGWLSYSRRKGSTFTKTIKLSGGASVEVTFSSGKLKIALIPGIEIEISRGELLELARGTRSFETMLRSTMRLNKGMSRKSVTSFLLERLGILTETQIDGAKGRKISTHLIEVSGRPNEIRSKILTKTISVENAKGKPVDVKISLVDYRALKYYKVTDPRYKTALANVQASIKKQAGVTDAVAVQRAKTFLAGERLNGISVQAQLYFRNFAEKVGLQVLRTALSKINPGDPKFNKKVKTAHEKAQLATIKFSMRARQMMLGKVAKGGFKSLSQTQIRTLFEKMAGKVSGEVRGLSKEQYKQDIKTIAEDLRAKTKTWRGRMALRAEHYGSVGPRGSVRAVGKAMGFNAGKGFLIGAALMGIIGTGQQLLTKGSVSGTETLRMMLESGWGWVKFELAMTAGRVVGMGAKTSMAFAIGLPHLWDLRAADPAQRGVVFSASVTNLGVFMGTHIGVSALLARIAPKMPGWLGKGVALTAAMGTSIASAFGYKFAFQNSKWFRAAVNNPVTRTLGEGGAIAAIPYTVYSGVKAAAWVATKAGAGRLALKLAAATRFLTGVGTFAAIFFHDSGSIPSKSRLYGSLKNLLEGKGTMVVGLPQAGKSVVFRKGNWFGPAAAGVYFSVGYQLYKKGLLKGSFAGYSLAKIFSNPKNTEPYAKAIKSRAFRKSFGKAVNAAILRFKAKVRSTGRIIDEDINRNYRSSNFISRQYFDFKIDQAKRGERARFAKLLGGLKASTRSLVRSQKAMLKGLKVKAKKEVRKALERFVIGTARGLQKMLKIKYLGNARNFVDWMIRADKRGWTQRNQAKVLKLMKKYGVKMKLEDVKKLAAYIRARYDITVMVAWKQYQHIGKQVDKQLSGDYLVRLPKTEIRSYFKFLRSQGITGSLRPYLRESKLNVYYTKYLRMVKGPQDMLKRYSNPSALKGRERTIFKVAYGQYCKRNNIKDSSLTVNDNYRKYVKLYIKRTYALSVEGVGKDARADLMSVYRKRPFNAKMFYIDIPRKDSRSFMAYLKTKYPKIATKNPKSYGYYGTDYFGVGTARALFSK
jgi:adenosine deaminase